MNLMLIDLALVNYVLNNAYNDPTSYRNVSKAISTGSKHN